MRIAPVALVLVLPIAGALSCGDAPSVAASSVRVIDLSHAYDDATVYEAQADALINILGVQDDETIPALLLGHQRLVGVVHVAKSK